MSGVVSIAGKVKLPRQVNDRLVKYLEDRLKEAQDGRLQSIATACVYANDLEPGGATDCGWSIAPMTNFALSHALAALNLKISRALHED